MSVILNKAVPPFQAVAKLGGKAAQVYGVLWASGLMDVRPDPRLHLDWEDRRDCGGTSTWTVKGLADHLGSCRKSISQALCLLLDEGFIQVQGYAKSSRGSKHTIWRITHPNDLEACRSALLQMGSPSKRWQEQMKAKGYIYEGEIWDTTNDPINWELEGFDPNYHGLYGEGHAQKVTQRVAYYNMTTARFAANIDKNWDKRSHRLEYL